jgi:hypothetical protein
VVYGAAVCAPLSAFGFAKHVQMAGRTLRQVILVQCDKRRRPSLRPIRTRPVWLPPIVWWQVGMQRICPTKVDLDRFSANFHAWLPFFRSGAVLVRRVQLLGGKIIFAGPRVRPAMPGYVIHEQVQHMPVQRLHQESESGRLTTCDLVAPGRLRVQSLYETDVVSVA